MKQILVIAEIFADQIRPVTWELVAAARAIETNPVLKQHSPAIHIIVPADDPKPLAEKIAKQTGMDVIGLQIPGLKAYTSEIYIYCLGQLIREMNPSHILVAHTSQGRDFAPGLAMSLNAASISGVNDIRSDEEGLIYSRPVFNNSKNLLVRPTANQPVVLSLMAGIFKPDDREEKKPGQVKLCKIPFILSACGKERIQHRRTVKRACEDQALKKAKVIVAAGRGVKEKNLKFIFRFAQCFSDSAVGSSRPLVDMNWIGYQHQVGITGATVAPKVYIACGISGSSQHLAGIKEAEFVVSINKNPQAPIFRHSDICIVADVIEFIECFLKSKYSATFSKKQ
ncbi:MAG: electron transfer flavoprotein subunit alpha/FixB family protein [Pseudomonadota bacterium]|nr:electron transfer flavoprotein subunit alpha/FixB family protein [Pseudomonadota bacterium]